MHKFYYDDEFYCDDDDKIDDDDNGRSILFPNADDEEYEEQLMDMCFKEL